MLNTRQIKARFWERHTNKINGYQPCGLLKVAEINPSATLFGKERPNLQVVALDQNGKRHVKYVFEETTVQDIDAFIVSKTAMPSEAVINDIKEVAAII